MTEAPSGSAIPQCPPPKQVSTSPPPTSCFRPDIDIFSGPAPALPTCAKCSKPESNEDEPVLKPCISCKSVQYCSRDCKKADTKAHKKVCASLAQEYMKTADIKMASKQAPTKDAHRGGLQKWQFDT